MLSKYSFFQRPQNCSIRYWTLLHLFVAYKSSLTNTPGGGRATFDFIIMRWFGVKGSSACGSLIPSTVNGRLLTIAMASYSSVLREASSSRPGHCAKVAFSTFLMVLICRSQTPPAWLAEGALKTNSHCLSVRKISSSLVSQCLSASLNSFLAPMKLEPWSQCNCRTAPLRLIKHLNALMNESVDKSSSISIWTALEYRHVKIRPYLLYSLRAFFYNEWTKTVHATTCKRCWGFKTFFREFGHPLVLCRPSKFPAKHTVAYQLSN